MELKVTSFQTGHALAISLNRTFYGIESQHQRRLDHRLGQS